MSQLLNNNNFYNKVAIVRNKVAIDSHIMRYKITLRVTFWDVKSQLWKIKSQLQELKLQFKI